MINLNEDQFDGGGNVKIFNGGKAGVVENTTMSVSRKKPEDKEGSPEFKLNFTDTTGATCSTSFWSVEKETAYKSIDQQIQAQGKVLKHVLHAIYGKSFEIPGFPTAKAMLEGCMKLINEGLKSNPTLQFRIFANYGTPDYSKSFIQPRSWVPFVEPMTVAIADTKLVQGDLDGMVRLTKDELAPASADSLISGGTSDDDDWE